MNFNCRTHRPCGQRRFIYSLSGRLILIFAAMGLLFLLLVGWTIGRGLKNHFESNIRPHLLQYLEYVQADIGTPQNYSRIVELSRRLLITIQIDGPDGSWSSDGQAVDLAGTEVFRRVEQGGRAFAFGKLKDREFLLSRNGNYTYAYSIPRQRSEWDVFAPLLVLLAILLLLYHATRRLFAPIQTIKSGVERIGRGEFDHRITVSRCDELGDLAASINGMAADVQQMLDSKRQLLLAISHELRSPLTRAKVATGLLDDEAQRSEIERELNDLETLVEELLETERLASRHQALHKQNTDLGELAREVMEKLRGNRAPKLYLPAEPIIAEVDAMRIRLLLKNLLENALRHTPSDAAAPELRIGLQAAETERNNRTKQTGPGIIEFTVRDYGPGIPAEHLPHVAEPFYRVDPARRRETGGYGLGLFLCRRIAEVHGGSLDISSETHSGTRVRVRLPMSS
ncbi:HAMP domain-containing histidine kinase [Candidatus Methylospira mobilis]|uniref:histidine kinase n=1 Tax=Candidatus Methylospira mobilis TaxID=1808979 RepID=A0A5Q0BPS6_9GAMM|nr:HAMP domain-containing sensor histidine kinase [Candidatus Methylospira mobilis]QFY44088.1 HAMP domain-containing histidine kinase [Candidatus Methylospira mobilis]WNV06510.1 HAMP domain-containing sensor histidine kinase [Candidatus Methylospira mobilis]